MFEGLNSSRVVFLANPKGICYDINEQKLQKTESGDAYGKNHQLYH